MLEVGEKTSQGSGAVSAKVCFESAEDAVGVGGQGLAAFGEGDQKAAAAAGVGLVGE